MSTVLTSDLEVRKAKGRAHLHADEIENAVGIFAAVLRDYPEDIESYIVLGDCYLAGDDGEMAAELYLKALSLDPFDSGIENRLALAHAESTTQTNHMRKAEKTFSVAANIDRDAVAPGSPTDSETIAALLENLTRAVDKPDDFDLNRAEQILSLIETSQDPGQVVTENLDEIIQILPALIQLNIRQAEAESKHQLAFSLRELLKDFQQDAPGVEETRAVHINVKGKSENLLPSVLFVGPETEATPHRQNMPAKALSKMGCKAVVRTDFPQDGLEKFDVIIVNRPHNQPELLEGMALCKAANIPIILDIDIDCERMPLEHPLYETSGLGRRSKAQAYAAALVLADKICVSSNTLATIMHTDGYDAEMIPPGWVQDNDLWHLPTPKRHTINIAWLGHPGQIEDIANIKRMIVRVMREFPQTNLVIGAEPRAYQLFDRLPESQLLYLPPTSMEDYPYCLCQADILLAPLRNTPFNRSQSDQILMDAGIRGIPWVASSIPSFTNWGDGGLIATSLNEWHTHLRQLIMDKELREAFGEVGRLKVLDREMSNLGYAWLNMVRRVVRG